MSSTVCDPLSAPMLAIVWYPTIRESEQNWDKLTDLEKEEVNVRKQAITQWEAACLKSADQLPDLEGTELTLVWDCVEEHPGTRCTVIRHGDKQVWREPACFGGYERFREVVEILKQKYGGRLADLTPTSASELYLYGDSLSAADRVASLRESLTKLRR